MCCRVLGAALFRPTPKNYASGMRLAVVAYPVTKKGEQSGRIGFHTHPLMPRKVASSRFNPRSPGLRVLPVRLPIHCWTVAGCMNPYRPFHPSQLRDSGRFSLHFPCRLKLQAASFLYHVCSIIANIFWTPAEHRAAGMKAQVS